MSDATRRDVLQGAAGFLVCFTAAQLAAIEAIAGDKPVLTPTNLEAKLPASARERDGVLAAIEADPKGWIRENFFLTKEQAIQLDSIPEADITAFKALVAKARSTGKPMRLGGLTPVDTGGASWSSTYTKPGGGAEDRAWRMKTGEHDGALVLTMGDAAAIDKLTLDRFAR